MTLQLRESEDADLPFMQKMLYEAVFWRRGIGTPSLEEGLAYPDVSKALADWGNRDGDVSVIATVHSTPVGAAWYRYWTNDNFIRGYVDEKAPVLVIGVHRDYRQQGIGSKMIDWLLEYASEHAVSQISLSVSKDNYAINLYRQKDFLEVADSGDSFLMMRTIVKKT